MLPLRLCSLLRENTLAPTLIDFLRSMTELGNGTLAKNIDQSNARLLGSINSSKFDFVPFEAGYLNIWWYLR